MEEDGAARPSSPPSPQVRRVVRAQKTASSHGDSPPTHELPHNVSSLLEGKRLQEKLSDEQNSPSEGIRRSLSSSRRREEDSGSLSTMSDPKDQREARRRKILARGADRLKFITGEVKDLGGTNGKMESPRIVTNGVGTLVHSAHPMEAPKIATSNLLPSAHAFPMTSQEAFARFPGAATAESLPTESLFGPTSRQTVGGASAPSSGVTGSSSRENEDSPAGMTTSQELPFLFRSSQQNGAASQSSPQAALPSSRLFSSTLLSFGANSQPSNMDGTPLSAGTTNPFPGTMPFSSTDFAEELMRELHEGGGFSFPSFPFNPSSDSQTNGFGPPGSSKQGGSKGAVSASNDSLRLNDALSVPAVSAAVDATHGFRILTTVILALLTVAHSYLSACNDCPGSSLLASLPYPWPLGCLLLAEFAVVAAVVMLSMWRASRSVSQNLRRKKRSSQRNPQDSKRDADILSSGNASGRGDGDLTSDGTTHRDMPVQNGRASTQLRGRRNRSARQDPSEQHDVLGLGLGSGVGKPQVAQAHLSPAQFQAAEAESEPSDSGAGNPGLEALLRGMGRLQLVMEGLGLGWRIATNLTLHVSIFVLTVGCGLSLLAFLSPL
eukprot:TRINITY_DN26725_c0_g1_i1.p1 TRINITY_DN26725_c0_g1~~TRINITY_DN26725_c0_g1_i1.p1  ORF type:complete len:608 (+),score=87.65 TRINITY_DN26725_c0_g1_i1:105-1928(+)